MSRFHAYTRFKNPGLHVWREGTDVKLYLHPDSPVAGPGWVEFAYDLEPGLTEPARFMLFEFDERGAPGKFEKDEHQRVLPRIAQDAFPEAVWFVHGTQRVLMADPREKSADRVRVHLISLNRYRRSELFVWDTASGAERRVPYVDEDHLGPYFDLDLQGQERSFFSFKFIRRDENGEFKLFEPDFANRLWTADDGGEIWTHSEAAEVAAAEPQKRKLRIHYRQELDHPARMRVWQENSDYEADVEGTPGASGWTRFDADVYTNLGYGLQFWNPDMPQQSRWEHPEAKREHVKILADKQYWTFEGASTLFDSEPKRDKQIELTIAAKPPYSSLGGQLFAHVWINRARAPISASVPVANDGRVSLATYPGVVTSVKFYDEGERWEAIERHPIQVPFTTASLRRYVVLDRPPLLEAAPPADLFRDPPFVIRRPGAYEEDGFIHFVVHAPNASRVRVIGEWAGWDKQPLAMHCTRDGAYWWARVSRQDLLAGLPAGATDYHGVKYQLLLNDSERFQDPAAGWMDSSWNQGTSRLVQSDKFIWHDQQWGRPGWESLIVYQLHASRFSGRFQSEPPLLRIAREIDDNAGYLRGLGVTAIQLLPVNEVGTQNSWGYDPAFFYAIEHDYGGPDALKTLVDTCHRHGLAVLVDVVFNHTGNIDNILWQIARESFFDGDTKWGAMINFDQPQCLHFFAQNLVYLAQEYHIDGFRLDHTATIVHSGAWDDWSSYVRVLGSGGGWEFLHELRHAIWTQVDPRCIFIAEHLPNEWSLTNYGGPMDSQWCDDFHDRMVDACKRQFGMSRLADAFKLSHTACDDWYKVTNYPESHDEVGNVRDRVSYVAGWGQGLRMSKVAAAGTLLSRGIPMFFMGAESGEDQQFTFGGSSTLDLSQYLTDPDKSRLRAWWRELCWLHRNPSIQGPSPLDVRFAEGQILAFSRGHRDDYFVLLNFGGWAGDQNLGYLNLPDGSYRELWNSTWPAFAMASEREDEHTNGGRDARLNRSHWLHVPDYGAVVLERAD